MLLTLYFLFIVYLETTYILWQLTKIKTENAPIILSKQKYDERIWWPEKSSCHCGTFLCCKVFIRTSYLTFQQSCLFKSIYFTSALLKNVCEHFKYIVSWNDNTHGEHSWFIAPHFYYLKCLQIRNFVPCVCMTKCCGIFYIRKGRAVVRLKLLGYESKCNSCPMREKCGNHCAQFLFLLFSLVF